MRAIKGYRDEWRIQEYLLITFFVSWFCWGLLALLTALGAIKFMSVLGVILFLLGGFGPTFSAIMCIEGKITFKKILRLSFSYQKKSWWAFVLISLLLGAVIGVSSGELNPAFPWYSWPIVLLATTFIGGGNEELGWRGTLQPILDRVITARVKNKTLGFIATVVIVGAVWAIWHLPLWFVVGSTQQGMNFGVFALQALFLSFLLGYIYRKTGSVFFCMIFHGLANLLMGIFIIKVNPFLIISFIVLAALSVLLSTKTQPAKPPKEEV